MKLILGIRFAEGEDSPVFPRSRIFVISEYHVIYLSYDLRDRKRARKRAKRLSVLDGAYFRSASAPALAATTRSVETVALVTPVGRGGPSR